MKRLASIFLVACLAFMLAACDSSVTSSLRAEPPVEAVPLPLDEDALEMVEVEEESRIIEIVPQEVIPQGDDTEDGNVPSAENSAEYGNAPSTENAFGLSIAIAGDDFLDTFDSLHELDYSLVRTARDGGASDDIVGDRLVIWADVPLREFALISIGNDFVNEEMFFIPMDSFGMVSELSPGEAFVVNSYVGMGTMPWSGIAFVAENGDRMYFTISQDQSGYFDPYILRGFENRTDELPEDWQPWWDEN